MAINGCQQAAISNPNLERLVACYRAFSGSRQFSNSNGREWDAFDRNAGRERRKPPAGWLMLQRQQLSRVFEFSLPDTKPQDPERPFSDHGFHAICVGRGRCVGRVRTAEVFGVRLHCPVLIKSGLPRGRGTYGRDHASAMCSRSWRYAIQSPVAFANAGWRAMQGNPCMRPSAGPSGRGAGVRGRYDTDNGGRSPAASTAVGLGIEPMSGPATDSRP